MKNWPCAILACAWLGVPAAHASGPVPTAVFDFGFDDTSLQGQEQGARADQQRRLQALDGQLRALLARSGCCRIVPTAGVTARMQDVEIWNCNGCDVDLAREAGARISVFGWVQKVSNLILNINLVARDVATGKVVEAGSVDIRGNTDESWSRGLAYLLRDRLHPANW